ncbi:single-stranded DNA-binding protein [Jatrophihabitans sp. YIM 134969]
MSPRTATAESARPDAAVPWQNTVVLCGRLTAGPEPVELPSGDPLWRFRVTVERPTGRTARAGEASRRVVDAVDCSTGLPKVAQRLERLAVGSPIEVSGMLTRRFWRSAGGPASRYEVVVDRVTAVRRSTTRASA